MFTAEEDMLSACLIILSTMLVFFNFKWMFFHPVWIEFKIFLSKVGLLNMSMLFKESLFFVSVLLICLLVFYWAIFYMENTGPTIMFFFSLTLFGFSMILLIFSNSFLMLFLGWEGLGLTSFLLIIFYQNWVSFKGGLLTMLTNRLGDMVFLGSFSLWVLKFSFISLFSGLSIMLLISLLLISSTKSAQFPFFSWLPAAMAAPTPVSALVHSSTLVTAGVWILIRFNISNVWNSLLMFILGSMTLLLASLAAMAEMDAKKLVALSTLSQLGLMFLSLFSSNVLVTLFHLLSHAFAKASLFLVIGSLIHTRFSYQDIRKMMVSEEDSLLFLMMFVSIASLTEVFFFSGFYSKDFVLLNFAYLSNNIIGLSFNLFIITLTIVYCVKLAQMLINAGAQALYYTKSSSFKVFPSLVLSLASFFFGFMFIKNAFLMNMVKTSFVFLWVFLLMSVLLLFFLSSDQNKKIFSTQDLIISGVNKMVFTFFKKVNTTVSITESVLLFTASNLSGFIFMMSRVFLLMSVMLLFFLIF